MKHRERVWVVRQYGTQIREQPKRVMEAATMNGKSQESALKE